MKKLIYTFLISASAIAGYAQNDPNITQWMFNRNAINPAAAGANKGLELSLWGREQWWGLEGRPSTQMLNGSYYISQAKSGIGLVFLYDRLGFQKNITARLNYSYHLTLSENMYLAFGVSGGIINTQTDLSKFNFGTPNTDPLLGSIRDNAISPDVAAGLELVHKNFTVGLSGNHLLGSPTSDFPTYARNITLYGTYSIQIGDNTRIVPGVLVRTPIYLIQAEANVLGYFLKDRFWVGAGYRLGHAVSGLAGVQIVKGLRLGYSYDFSINRLQPYNSGTHELMLSYSWKKPRKRMPYYLNPRLF
jgi:type IX secretion system PorP/SprF family membrane protein